MSLRPGANPIGHGQPGTRPTPLRLRPPYSG